MTLSLSFLFRRATTFRLHHRYMHLAASIAVLLCLQTCPWRLLAQAAAAPPDVLVLSNGDTLHGKFINVINGKVTFHSDPLGDVTLEWD